MKLVIQIVDDVKDIPSELSETDPVYLDKETFNKIVLLAKEQGITLDEVIERGLKRIIQSHQDGKNV